MKRTYLVPKDGTGSHQDPYRAGYCDGIPYSGRDYGNEPVFLATINVEEDMHRDFLAKPDVAYVHQDVPPDPKTLEALKIPGETYGHHHIEHLHRMFSLMQRCQGHGVNPLAGRHLDDPIAADDLERLRAVVQAPMGATMRQLAAAASRRIPMLALPASDNFNRADSNPISGGNWTGVVNNLQITTNIAYGNTFAYALAYWSADAFNADHYSQVKLATSPSDGGPAVRVSAGPNSYHFDLKAGNNCNMVKLVAGSFTNLQTGLTSPANGDTCYIEVVGTTIKVKINGVQVGTDQTDSSLSSGSAGIFDYDQAGGSDDFLADNIGAAVTSPYPPWPPQLNVLLRQ